MSCPKCGHMHILGRWTPMFKLRHFKFNPDAWYIRTHIRTHISTHIRTHIRTHMMDANVAPFQS